MICNDTRIRKFEVVDCFRFNYDFFLKYSDNQKTYRSRRYLSKTEVYLMLLQSK